MTAAQQGETSRDETSAEAPDRAPSADSGTASRSSSDERPRKIARWTTTAVSALTEADRQAMFRLFRRYYDAVTEARFLADLAEKQSVIRMFGPDGELHGFSTIQWLESESGGRRCLTLFSGDTVVDHRCWGQKALQRAFVWNVFRMKLTRPRARVFWFLITKGYKTYLLMQRNFPCHPSRLRAFPPDMKRLLDEVARRKFGDGYDAGAGIVRFEECQGKVKGAFEDLGESERDDPDIAFFLEANPGFREGDELCCLTEIGFRELAGVIGKYFIKKPLGRLFSRSR